MNETSLIVKTREIRKGLHELASLICSGDESKLLLWVIPDQLACAHRPLRYHEEFGGRENLVQEAKPAFLKWMERMEHCGIKSIITLLHPKELSHYDNLGLGCDLLQFYRQQGFEVCHIPWEDPAHRRQDEMSYQDNLQRVRIKALDKFGDLLKPVLLHCSAGQDRSAPVAAYIFINRSE